MYVYIFLYEYIYIYRYIYTHIYRVVSSKIPNLERKRGQYQMGLSLGLSERRIASRYLQNVWNEPCRGFGFVTF